MTAALRFDPIRLPPECEELRKEVRAFLADEIAAGTFDPHKPQREDSDAPEFSRRVGERGWLGMHGQVQLHGKKPNRSESFIFVLDLPEDDEDRAAGHPLHDTNKWPEGLPEFRATMEEYWRALRFLAPKLMRGLARMTEKGVKLSWGPGRHTAGNNTFTYYLTPNGNAVEYTSDLEHVDEATWVPTTYQPGPNTIDQWGTGRIITGNVPHAEMTPDKGLWQVPA